MNTEEPITVPVLIYEGALPCHCLLNVERKVSECGGRVVYGWIVKTETRLFTTHTHHAVWKSPDGELFDVTPLSVIEDGMMTIWWGDSIKFVVDEEAQFIGPSGERRARPTRYIPKQNHPTLVRAAEYLSRADEAMFEDDIFSHRYWTKRANEFANRYLKKIGSRGRVEFRNCF